MWTQSKEGRVLEGNVWKTKWIWNRHSEYPTLAAAQRAALVEWTRSGNDHGPRWRVLEGDERPAVELELR